METVTLYYDMRARGTPLQRSLPGLLEFSIKKRHILMSGFTDYDRPMLIRWAQTHTLPVEERRTHAWLPLNLLSSPVGRSIRIENELAALGLNTEFRADVGRRIAFLALELSDHAQYGFHMSVDVDVLMAEGVPEEEEEGEASDANSSPAVPAAARQIMRDRMEKEYRASDGGSCSICMEEFATTSRVMKMSCSHTFHSTCILTWLHRRNSCPICRRRCFDDASILGQSGQLVGTFCSLQL